MGYYSLSYDEVTRGPTKDIEESKQYYDVGNILVSVIQF
jgi:hypothetical protein